MSYRRNLNLVSVAGLPLLLLFSLMSAGGVAQERLNPAKPAQRNVQKISVAKSLPDLAAEKIELDKDCNLIFTVSNGGPGAIPEDLFKDCVIQVRIGQYQENFYLGMVSKRNKPPVDPNGVLLKPGGRVSFNTGIRIQEETKAAIYVDFQNKIEESNNDNNRSSTVALKPNCYEHASPIPSKGVKPPIRKTLQSSGALQKDPGKDPAGRKAVRIPAGTMRTIPRISEAFDLVQGSDSRIVVRGQSFGSEPDGRSIRLVRANTEGDPVMNFFLSVRSWSNEEIIADMPDTLENPSNPSERGTHLSERTGSFTVGLYNRSETRWLSNEVAVHPGTGRAAE